MISLYSVLGLDENASDPDVDEAYVRLKNDLNGERFRAGPVAAQAAQCRKAIDHAYYTITKPELRTLYLEQRQALLKGEKTEKSHPRLGQLCVASGMITMDHLKEAVQSQVASRLPLGEVLLEKQFINQEQLDGLLLGQEIIDVPSAVRDATAIRLISLGILSEDMALIAQMEHRSQGIPVRDIVVRHGWIDPRLLNILFKKIPKP